VMRLAFVAILVAIAVAPVPQKDFTAYRPGVRGALRSVVHAMQAMDEEEIAKKSVRPSNLEKALDVAMLNQVDKSFARDAFKNVLPAGGSVFRMTFMMDNAVSMAFNFAKFNPVPGAALFVIPQNGTFGGPWTAANRFQAGEFQTWHYKGSSVSLEYYSPSGTVSEGEIELAIVATAWKQQKAGACNIHNICRDPNYRCNAGCPVGRTCSFQCSFIDQDPTQLQWAEHDWDEEANAAVVMLSAAGSRFCSGSFVNNPSGLPYVLTAHHCRATATTLIKHAFWNPECESYDDEAGDTSKVLGDSQILRTVANSDATLMHIREAVPGDWDLFLAGWDARGPQNPAVGAIGVHHPRASNMKLAHTYIALRSTGYGGAGNTHWTVDFWGESTTEPGSSGSPVYNRDTKKIVGQLHGGSASCANTGGPSGWDGYGALWQSYANFGFREFLGPDAVMDGAYYSKK